MNKTKLFLAGVGASAVALVAQAAIPASLTTLMTDANTMIVDVQDFAIVVAVFSIILGIVLKIRSKTAK